MKITFGLVFVCLLASCQQNKGLQTGFQDELLDHFAGKWILQGTIAGGPVTHDIVAEWVLAHQYMRFHEVSRELDEHGNLAYEAIVFIGWDETIDQYACLWLDSTGGGGLNTDAAMGHATRSGDSLPFLFDMGDGNPFHTTFEYNRKSDSWQWRMDAEKDGKFKPFARVKMTKR